MKRLALIIGIVLMVILGVGRPVPYAGAEDIQALMEKAKQGDPQAEADLGKAYEYGHGVSKKPGQAVYWYKKAAEQGNAWGEAGLGLYYMNGLNGGLKITPDYKKALDLFKKAADQKNPRGEHGIGMLYSDSAIHLAKNMRGQGESQDSSQDRKVVSLGSETYLNYLNRIRERFTTIGEYPPEAAARGVSGRVLITFTLSPEGRLLNIQLAQSSGSPVLDLEALRIVRVALTDPYKPLPTFLKKDLTLTWFFNFYQGRFKTSFSKATANNSEFSSTEIPSHSEPAVISKTSSSDSHTTSSSSKAISETTPPPPSPSDSQLSQEIQQLNQQVSMLSNRLAGSGQGGASPKAPTYHSSVDRPSYRETRHRKDFALVIGVEKYPSPIHAATFADRDAQAMFAHLRALGVPVRHIKRLSDETATRGRIKGALHWLKRNVQAGSTVYVYFSGHGAPGQKGHAYLVPFDGDPSDLSDTGFSTATFYRDLERLPAKHVIVALDACFTGEGKRSILGSGIRPLVTKIREGSVPRSGKLVVLTAARSDQESGVIDSKGHGLFTYYLLKGLNGGAERGGHVTVVSLYRYLKPKVQSEASLDNRNQTPELAPMNVRNEASVQLR